MSAQTANPAKTPLIFIVDDEAVVTQSLGALLELETDYRILTFQSPVEALAAAQNVVVDLVISDFLMPQMNGLEFLSEFKNRHPDTPRIMLTGYADKENSIRAINEIGLFQYIEKPWDNDQIQLVIENALTNKSLRETLRLRIGELDAALRERKSLIERDELLREELQIARRLQLGMLPATLPLIDGMTLSAEYLPALEIGGDFYDVMPLSENRMAFLIADITGHGIQAALSTAVVKLAFSDFRNCDCSAGDILAGMNQVLLRAMPEDAFAAALVVIVDTNTRECQIVNAGLPHPFLLRRDKSQVDRVIVNGFMLGALDESLFRPEPEQNVQLSQGDFLMIYTDGLGEVQNKAGNQFDETTLQENMIRQKNDTGVEIARHLIAASREYGRPDHLWDDVTILGFDSP